MSDAPVIQRRGLTILLTSVAMVAFAANSILCRMALLETRMEWVDFALIRLGSGAVTLMLCVALRDAKRGELSLGTLRSPLNGDWISGLMLAIYAIGFAVAYVRLEVGTGALILFAAVQTTMILVGLWRGERPRLTAWLGIVLAIGGAVYLMQPGDLSPDGVGAWTMAVAGLAWGIYSLRAKGGRDPLATTAGNFALALLWAALLHLAIPAFGGRNHAWLGVWLAVGSGAIASGLGYVIWYAALRGLKATQAAVVQLTVPMLAALGGVVLLDEVLSLRLALASLLILGGVALVALDRGRR